MTAGRISAGPDRGRGTPATEEFTKTTTSLTTPATTENTPIKPTVGPRCAGHGLCPQEKVWFVTIYVLAKNVSHVQASNNF